MHLFTNNINLKEEHMIEQDSWKPYNEVNFSDKSFNSFHIDTRDFFCNCMHLILPDSIDIERLNNSKKSRFFHTPEEVMILIDRLYAESGGAGQWRMLDLISVRQELAGGWQLKYIRIYQTIYGLLVCNKDSEPINKEILSSKVNQKYLDHQ